MGVALPFGLTVLTMVYAIGHISGCHLNPSVTAGLAAAYRFPLREVPFYVIAQVAGAMCAKRPAVRHRQRESGFEVSAGFAANGYGAHSPGGYSLLASLLPSGFADCLALVDTISYLRNVPTFIRESERGGL
jgi:aquaporin Z